jgi:hypothetical protein
LWPFFLREKGERPKAFLVRALADEEFEIARWVRPPQHLGFDQLGIVAPEWIPDAFDDSDRTARFLHSENDCPEHLSRDFINRQIAEHATRLRADAETPRR